MPPFPPRYLGNFKHQRTLILPSISFLIEDCVPAVQGFCCVFVLAVDEGKRLCGPNVGSLLQGPSGSQLHEGQGAGHC